MLPIHFVIVSMYWMPGWSQDLTRGYQKRLAEHLRFGLLLTKLPSGMLLKCVIVENEYPLNIVWRSMNIFWISASELKKTLRDDVTKSTWFVFACHTCMNGYRKEICSYACRFLGYHEGVTFRSHVYCFCYLYYICINLYTSSISCRRILLPIDDCPTFNRHNSSTCIVGGGIRDKISLLRTLPQRKWSNGISPLQPPWSRNMYTSKKKTDTAFQKSHAYTKGAHTFMWLIYSYDM